MYVPNVGDLVKLRLMELNVQKMPNRLPLQLEEAQQRGLCRVCGDPADSLPGNPFIYNFGKEHAHELCLKKLNATAVIPYD